VTHPLRSGRLRRSAPVAFPLLLGLSTALQAGPARAQQALFGAGDVEQQRFVLVAAPIGSSGDRYQLNIYEQVNDRRPCFAVGSSVPSPVNPLLATFDFTGICGRYIDANGYSLRVGGADLAATYRLTVRGHRVAGRRPPGGRQLRLRHTGSPESRDARRPRRLRSCSRCPAHCAATVVRGLGPALATLPDSASPSSTS